MSSSSAPVSLPTVSVVGFSKRDVDVMHQRVAGTLWAQLMFQIYRNIGVSRCGIPAHRRKYPPNARQPITESDIAAATEERGLEPCVITTRITKTQ